MNYTDPNLSTGISELDEILHGLLFGDNIVWQVEKMEDYAKFVEPFSQRAVEKGRTLVYFRFASHEPLKMPSKGCKTYELDPQEGFESFLGGIHAAIEEAGRGAFYVFDCLSDLAVDWFSDQMLGNFFRLTCPYLYDMETIAYFALFRDYHSKHATVPIRETTQLFMDLFQHKEHLYLRPLKVQHRQSPTMHMLHVWENKKFEPLTDSCTIAEILNSNQKSVLEVPLHQLDVWNRTFIRAEEALRESKFADEPSPKIDELFQRLLRVSVSRDERVLELAQNHFSIEDLLEIGRRTIGTGLIGGKSVGMLLARAIVVEKLPHWRDLLEIHDSFYIASDVFYTYLVQNGCWWIRQNQKDSDDFLEGAQQARRRIMTGTLPENIIKRFAEILDYYGESPIIVRSSSLQEDNFGNSFAGKYESVFCPNQGSHAQRLENFVTAVKTVYASSMSEKALTYRHSHGLLERDEQMALLVQRVSGSQHGTLFHPNIAGVGFSHNIYVWNENIDPNAGLLRLVFGLGTRAVDRSDEDYTRIVALNAPEQVPESASEDLQRYAQRKVDVIDLAGNQLITENFDEVAKHCRDESFSLFASHDSRAARRSRQEDKPRAKRHEILTFKNLFSKTNFVENMRDMLRVLEEAYDYPVDVEFTANFKDADNYKVNIVQCRPLQLQSDSPIKEIRDDIKTEHTIIKSSGPVIGRSRLENIDCLIYVVPQAYADLVVSDKYSVARLIGRLTNHEELKDDSSVMLLGPGRWGTSTPFLGVPVSFAEIERVNCLCEIVEMRDGLVPDVSFGSHFFSEIVEDDILYMALFPSQEDTLFQRKFFETSENKLLNMLPDAGKYEHVVRVVDATQLANGETLKLYANSIKQRVIFYKE